MKSKFNFCHKIPQCMYLCYHHVIDPGQEELSSNSDESDSEVHNHYMYMNDNEGGVSEQV